MMKKVLRVAVELPDGRNRKGGPGGM